MAGFVGEEMISEGRDTLSEARSILPDAKFIRSVTIVEDRWQGRVSVFESPAGRVYAWMADSTRAFAMPHKFPVESAMDAISTWLLMSDQDRSIARSN